MGISTKGRYALRMMIDIAKAKDGVAVSLKTVAENQCVSYKYLEQIVMPLTRAGLVKSQRGACGGYKLAKPASQIKAGDILRATEKSICPVDCVNLDIECDRRPKCQAFTFWKGLDDVIVEYVDSITLEDIVQNEI